MYEYFPTKNDLIVAALEHYRKTYKEHIHNLLNHDDMSSRKKLLTVFDDAMNWFDDTNFHGCLAVNAMGEFSGKDDAIETSCIDFKRWEVEMLCKLTKDLDDQYPVELAYKLFLLLEGMASIAQVTETVGPVDMTEMANDIIETHLSRIPQQKGQRTGPNGNTKIL